MTDPTPSTGLAELERIVAEEGVADDLAAERAFAAGADLEDLPERAAASVPAAPSPVAPAKTPELTRPVPKPVDSMGRTEAEREALVEQSAAAGRNPGAPVDSMGVPLDEAEQRTLEARAAARNANRSA